MDLLLERPFKNQIAERLSNVEVCASDCPRCNDVEMVQTEFAELQNGNDVPANGARGLHIHSIADL